MKNTLGSDVTGPMADSQAPRKLFLFYPNKKWGQGNPALHREWNMGKVQRREKKLVSMASPKKMRQPKVKWSNNKEKKKNKRGQPDEGNKQFGKEGGKGVLEIIKVIPGGGVEVPGNQDEGKGQIAPSLQKVGPKR